jgi:hypothetical protein
VTPDKAVEIVKATMRPDFYGDVTVRIKAGGVTAVDVRQTFVET